MGFQQEQQYHVSGVVIVGRLYNRMPHNILMDSQRSIDSTDTLMNTIGLRKNNVSLRRPPPLLLPGSVKQRRNDRRDDHDLLTTSPPKSLHPLLKKERRSERRKDRRHRDNHHRNEHREHDLTIIDSVKDAKDAPTISKRSSKAKAKKVRILLEQEQQCHEEQVQELQEHTVVGITATAIAEERFYNHKRNTSMTSQQTQDVLDLMELESNSSFSSEYNNITYNDSDNENDNDNDNNCFLIHLLPFFQFLKDKFDDQLLKSNP